MTTAAAEVWWEVHVDGHVSQWTYEKYASLEAARSVQASVAKYLHYGSDEVRVLRVTRAVEE